MHHALQNLNVIWRIREHAYKNAHRLPYMVKQSLEAVKRVGSEANKLRARFERNGGQLETNENQAFAWNKPCYS